MSQIEGREESHRNERGRLVQGREREEEEEAGDEEGKE